MELRTCPTYQQTGYLSLQAASVTAAKKGRKKKSKKEILHNLIVSATAKEAVQGLKPAKSG